jgi:endonuclease YncB( thermonuclease family)
MTLDEAKTQHRVVVEFEKTDRYRRLVGKVFLDGQDECLAQIAAGLAWHYKEYQREQPPED